MKLRKNYGITPEQHKRQIAGQGGKCAICQCGLADLSPQSVHVDHCHASGTLRGVLCGSCNVGLGSFRDSEQFLLRAITYLRAGGVWIHAETFREAA
ncbi:endonuclease VII domain-containing protein [Luteimonas sp. SJ-9]|uniref:endonuclease VII domain-containing protein n=1 Tax=Luteimonas saliphila TaxID=2804919 RepID=UPI00192D98B6